MSNHLDAWIQTYPDFPKPGILFYDIAPIIEWLASGTAAPLVGSSLVVDGGLWMPG